MTIAPKIKENTSMNAEQQLARNGGQALVEALNFVTICRTLDPLGNYLHIGDLQWWCRDGSLDDQQNWHFWSQENGEILALGLIVGNEILCLLQRLKERARQQGETQYEVWEEAADDDPDAVSFLEREGYERREMYYHC